MPGRSAPAPQAWDGPGRSRRAGVEHDGGRGDAIAFRARHRSVRPFGGPVTQLLCLPFGSTEERETQMKRIIAALAICSAIFAQDTAKAPATVKVTKIASPKALKFEV